MKKQFLGLILCALLAGVSGVASGQNTWHSADVDVSGHINLSELLRVVQFFNLGGLHYDESSEDGYSPGPGDIGLGKNHSSDYNPSNGVIGLDELLRTLQLFNAGGYLVSATGEDGYIPVRNSKGPLFDVIGSHDGSGPAPGFPGYDPNMHPLRTAKDVDVQGTTIAIASMTYNEVVILDGSSVDGTVPGPTSLPLVRVLQSRALPSGGEGLHPVHVTIIGNEVVVAFKKTVNTGYTEGAVGVFNLNDGTAVASVESPLLKDVIDAKVVGNNIFAVSFEGTLTKIVRSGSNLAIADHVTDLNLLNGASGIDVENGVAYVVSRNSRALVGYDTSDLSQIGFYQDTASNHNDGGFVIYRPRNVVVQNGYAYVSAISLIRTVGAVTTTYGYDVATFDTSTFSMVDGIKLPPWNTTNEVVPGLVANLDILGNSLIVGNPDGIYEIGITGPGTLDAPTIGDPLPISIDGRLRFAPNGDLYVLNQHFLSILR